MKKRFLLGLIVAVLALSVVGGCFALYTKNATPKTVTISADPDSVTLSIGGAESFALTELQPGAAGAKTVAITLSASHSDKVEEGKVGVFKIAVEANDSTKANDDALAKAVSVAATGTDKDSAAYSADYDDLKVGDEIELTKAPITGTLTFSLPDSFANGTNFMTVAEGAIKVTISWKVENAWKADSSKYYLVGSRTAWDLTKRSPVMSDAPGTNVAQKNNILLTAGEEFKILKGSGEEGDWLDCKGGDSTTVGDISIGTGTSLNNAVVNATGYYNIYVTNDGFYVGPGVDSAWDGTLTVDLSKITYLNDAGCVPFVYVWYTGTPETNNHAYPGVEATAIGGGKYTVATDTSKTIAGVIVSRVSKTAGKLYNKTTNITSFSVSHVIVVEAFGGTVAQGGDDVTLD